MGVISDSNFHMRKNRLDKMLDEATRCSRAGKIEAAVALWRDIIPHTKVPSRENKHARVTAGRDLAKLERLDDSNAIYDGVIADYEDDFAVFHHAAQVAFASNQRERSERLFREICLRWSDNPKGYSGLAKTLARRGAYSEASVILMVALSAVKARDELASECADILHELNEHETALRLLEKTPERVRSALHWHQYFRHLSAAGRHDDELTAMKRYFENGVESAQSPASTDGVRFASILYRRGEVKAKGLRAEDANWVRVNEAYSESIAGQQPFQPEPGRHRVAVCISGQLRGFDLAYPTIKKFMIDDLQADVFISTWRRRGIKMSGFHANLQTYFHDHFVNSVPLEYYGNNFLRKFPSIEDVMVELGESDLVTDDALSRLYPDAEIFIADEDEFENRIAERFSSNAKLFRARIPRNQIKMYYHIWKSNQMKCKAERRLGRRYDLVVRIRPDKELRSDMVSHAPLYPFEIFADKVKHRDSIGDRIAYGTSAAMDIYSDIWQRALDWEKGALPNGFRRNIAPHTFMFDHLWTAGLGIRAMPPQLLGPDRSAKVPPPRLAEAVIHDLSQEKNLSERDRAIGQAALNDAVLYIKAREGDVAAEDYIQKWKTVAPDFKLQ